MALHLDRLRDMLSPPYPKNLDHRFQDAWLLWLDLFNFEGCASFLLSGDHIEDESLADFGRQMLEHRFVAMPAEDIYFQWEASATGNNTHSLSVMVLEAEPDKLLRIGILKSFDGVGLSFPMIIDLYGENAFSLMNCEFESLPPQNITDIYDKRNMRMVLDELFGCLSLLVSKGTEKIHHGPSDRIKSKRVKKGLPPITEYVEIKTRSDLKHYGAGYSAERGSPRPHFRRGHIRELYRGTVKSRKVAVSPTFVNVDGQIPSLRPYRVT